MIAKPCTWLPVALLCVVTVPSQAADLNGLPSQSVPPPTDSEMRDALVERAILYDLRVAFDVMEDDAVGPTLKADARELQQTAFFEDQRSYVRQDLLAEGAYYIVSLGYLVRAGGAAWPIDRAGSVYESDAEVKLEALKQRWIASLEGDGSNDLLDIMRRVDAINAWTEGQSTLTPQLDHFGNVEALVTAVLKPAP